MIILIAKSVADQILSISQNNDEEENKIDFVLFLSVFDMPTISCETFDCFNEFPIEHSSDDWLKFKQTPFLLEAKKTDFFTTDYSYSISRNNTNLLATAIGDLTPDKIKQGDVPALYRKGKHTEETITNPQMQHELFVIKIRAIDAYLNNKSFEYLALPDNCTLYMEDMGFRIIVNGEIYAESFLGQDGTKSVSNAFKV